RRHSRDPSADSKEKHPKAWELLQHRPGIRLEPSRCSARLKMRISSKRPPGDQPAHKINQTKSD
ncbi:MAG: hypothetical protein KDK27_19135, partial [Leptospiraceae bacterium]|nr:hypothetical protein [Leptospiraceae bacterium]